MDKVSPTPDELVVSHNGLAELLLGESRRGRDDSVRVDEAQIYDFPGHPPNRTRVPVDPRSEHGTSWRGLPSSSKPRAMTSGASGTFKVIAVRKKPEFGSPGDR